MPGAGIGAADAVSASRPAIGEDVVLTVAADGAILGILQAPGSGDSDLQRTVGEKLDALWRGTVAARLRETVRAALRSRRLQREAIDCDGSLFEFTVLAQGRDRALVLARDISQQSEELSQIEELAYLDEGTRLPNRKFLRRELDTILDNLRLTEGRAALIFFDIEHLESHGIGYNPRLQEQVLKELATRLSHELRGVNQSTPSDYERYSAAARIDFRQFAVVLPSIESGDDAEAVTCRLLESLQQPIRLDDRSVSVAARAGIALFPQDGTDSDTLFENAAAAMEDARSGGGDSYKFHSGTVGLPALQRRDLEVELQAALKQEEFVLKFLPIVDAGSGAVQAVESLLRWPQTLFATRSISKLVALAEHTGLILPIGEWVLRSSARQLREWREAGHDDLRISVNLSVQELARADLAGNVSAILDDCGVDPAGIVFEITEYMLFRDAMKDYEVCNALKALGAGLTVDDFGTGACSLTHLAHSPVDAIKIDNSFVANAVDRPADRAACAAAAALARELGVTIIAEGVETAAQAGLMRELGCDLLQGFLFCEPQTADGIDAYLARPVAALRAG